jgi:hypothetical protein
MMSKNRSWSGGSVVWIACAAAAQAGAPSDMVFTHQGQLEQDGAPANGTYDFRFDLLSEGFRIGRFWKESEL